MLKFLGGSVGALLKREERGIVRFPFLNWANLLRSYFCWHDAQSKDKQMDLLASRSLKSKRFVRVVFKSTRARFRCRFTRFERRDLALHFFAGCRSRRSLRRHWIADRERIRFGPASGRPVFRAGSGPHEVVDSAGGHLDVTFFREYLGDVPIRPTPAPKLLYEFTVRLKAGARRLDWQFGQNFFQVGVHGGELGRSPPNYNATRDGVLTNT
jgi:hypothetical protein